MDYLGLSDMNTQAVLDNPSASQIGRRIHRAASAPWHCKIGLAEALLPLHIIQTPPVPVPSAKHLGIGYASRLAR